jgi:hypothetical protein
VSQFITLLFPTKYDLPQARTLMPVMSLTGDRFKFEFINSFFIFSFFYTFDCRYINLSNTIIIYFLSIKVKKGILEPQTIESNTIEPTFPDSENDEQLDLTHACILHIFKLAFIYNFAIYRKHHIIFYQNRTRAVVGVVVVLVEVEGIVVGEVKYDIVDDTKAAEVLPLIEPPPLKEEFKLVFET